MVIRIFIVLLVLFTANTKVLAAEEPRAVIQALCDQLQEVMKRGPALGMKGRADFLRPVLAKAYDMMAMTRSTLGAKAAEKLSEEERSRLAAAYSRFSVATYADQFAAWDGERFVVGETAPAADGMRVVSTQIVPSSGAPTRIDYLMHEVAGSWKIVDVLFDGVISQVAVRRSEFIPIFRRDGLAALIALLDERSLALESR